MNTKQFILLALGGVILASPAYLAARQDQSQGQESVVDAARKARAEKKDAPKSKMVIDNDNLGTLTGTVNVVGEASAQPADETKKPVAEKTPKSGEAVKDEAYWRQKFADANKKLADDQHELDIMQREFNLKQEQYYTDPMAALKQEYSRQDLNDSKTKIDDMTAKVDQDKSDISNLEDQLRQAGGDPGWATAPSQPAQPAPAPAPAPQS
jgi:chromosome segregation ATPase